MATRCKTVEFVFPTQQATLAASTPIGLTQLVYLPESGKVFRSVTLEVGCTDDLTASSSATSFAMMLTLGSAAPDIVTVTDTLTSSGESSVYHISRDVTNYFNSNWSGTSMVALTGITVGGNATNNHWAKLRITYDYDDQSAQQLKTIWYPIESTRELLTNSYQTIGGATAIPAINGDDSILPEAGVVVRQVWIELIGNQGTSDATDFSLDLKLVDDELEQTTLYRVEAALATPGWLHAIWNVTAAPLLTAQALEAKLTGSTGRVAQLCGWVGVTYEFTPSGTTSVWNSLLLPAFDAGRWSPLRAGPRKVAHYKELWIQEPTTIEIQPSQVFAFYGDNVLGSSISLWVGEQGERSFDTLPNGAPLVLAHRMDAGGVSGTGLTLARGRNQIVIHQFGDAANADAISNVSGFMIVNYTSGVSGAGIGAHNQTRHFALGWFAGDATSLTYTAGSSRTPAIPESYWFLNSVALHAAWMSTAMSSQIFSVQAHRTGTEGPAGDGAGSASAHRNIIASSAENWLRWTCADCSGLFRRWTGDPELERMDLEAGRTWTVSDAAGVWVGLVGLLVTYHSIAHTVRGTIALSSTAVRGVRVNLSREARGQQVLSVTTTASGEFEAGWFDDTEALTADAFDGELQVGSLTSLYAEDLYEPLADATLHASRHELGGDDQLDVTGLSGVLADPQTPATHAASHLSGGTDAIDLASESAAGLVQLATSTQTTAGLAVQASDTRLSDARYPTTHGSEHASNGDDPIPAATTSVRGIVELATDGEVAADLAVQANDSRLSDDRYPTTHGSEHTSTGDDPVPLASTSASGLLPALPTSDAALKVLTGTGSWALGWPFNYQQFVTSGTWTKPTDFSPQWVMVICIGGGGGGGGGGTNNTTARSGGCGGGGGAYHCAIFPASLFGATVAVTVGAGGSGGSGAATGASSGDDGEPSFFGDEVNGYYVYAGGGGGGYKGDAVTSSGQGGGGGGRGQSGSTGSGASLSRNEGGPGFTVVDSNSLAASGGTGCRGGFGAQSPISAEFGGGGGGGRFNSPANTQPGGSSLYGAGGGGVGGGGSTSPTAGGASANVFAGGGGAAGSNGAPGTSGTAGGPGDAIRTSGNGGGGGGARTSASSGVGRIGGGGGVPGGGGGGGGAGYYTTSATNGGNGGNGARGEVRVYTW